VLFRWIKKGKVPLSIVAEKKLLMVILGFR